MKKIISVISITAALSVLMLGPTMVRAEETNTPAGYVIVAAEKFTLGQKFLSAPKKVPYYEGETGADISDRYFGNGNVNGGKPTGTYLSSVADRSGTVEADIPAYILDAAAKNGEAIENSRSDREWLGSTDYCAMSGWFYGVNNEFSSDPISEYEPKDGNVIRFEFSVYGYGADIGKDNSSWGGPEVLVSKVNRDKLYTALAKIENTDIIDNALAQAYKNAVDTASDLKASQADIDKVYEEFQTAYAAYSGGIVTTAVPEVTTPSVTTTASTEVTRPSETTTASVTTKKAVSSTTSKTKASPATGEKSVMPLLIASCAVFAAGLVSKKRSK